MSSKLLLVGSIVALAMLAACGGGISITIDADGDGDDVAGSGTIVTESRNIGDFHEIRLAGEGTVVVTEGPAPSLTVMTDDNLHTHIETSVKGGALEIVTERGIDIDPTDSVRYEVTAPNIDKLTLTGAGDFEMSNAEADRFAVLLSGAGDIRIGDLVANELDVAITGAGDVVVAGEVTKLSVTLPGVGSYEGADLRSADATVTSSGVGSATVWATDELDASVTGVGSIDYYGSPRVTSSVTGIGSINSRGDA